MARSTRAAAGTRSSASAVFGHRTERPTSGPRSCGAGSTVATQAHQLLQGAPAAPARRAAARPRHRAPASRRGARRRSGPARTWWPRSPAGRAARRRHRRGRPCRRPPQPPGQPGLRRGGLLLRARPARCRSGRGSVPAGPAARVRSAASSPDSSSPSRTRSWPASASDSRQASGSDTLSAGRVQGRRRPAGPRSASTAVPARPARPGRSPRPSQLGVAVGRPTSTAPSTGRCRR